VGFADKKLNTKLIILSVLPAMGECVSIVRDIIGYIVSLIPPEDGDTVVALSCVAREYSGLFARWLQVNNIVDVRGFADDAEICLCDRMHGAFTRSLYFVDRYILIHRLRGYVAYYYDGWRPTFCITYTYQFKYGTLTTWGYGPDRIYEIVTVVGEPVIITVNRNSDSGELNLFVHMLYGSIDMGTVYVAQVTKYDVLLNQTLGLNNLPADKEAAFERLMEVDWRRTLAPYIARGPLKLK
jgi:hypothetical protein